jgi:putative polyketide hydroxylase
MCRRTPTASAWSSPPTDGAAAHGIGSGGALLVRPDGFIAWRSTHAAADPTAKLTRILRTILSAPA